MAEIFNGPYIITRVSDNNTATIKTLNDAKEYNYNTQVFKLFHPKKEQSETIKRKKRKIIKKKKVKVRLKQRDKRKYIPAEKMGYHQQGQKRPRKNWQ